MSKFIRAMTCAGALAAAFAAAPSHALTHSDIYGDSVADGTPVDRTIVIRPGQRVVSVEQGDIVKFVIQTANGAEQSFSWHFDGMPGYFAVGMPLSELSPLASAAGQVVVDVHAESDELGE